MNANPFLHCNCSINFENCKKDYFHIFCRIIKDTCWGYFITIEIKYVVRTFSPQKDFFSVGND